MKTKLLKIFAVMLMVLTALGVSAQEFSVGDLKYKINGGFAYCTGLTTAAQGQSSLSITIPSVVSNNGMDYRVMGVDANSFENETNLTGVYIRFGVSYIAGDAFKGCTGIKTVRLPSSLRTIYSNAFQGCTALQKVYYAGFSFPQGTMSYSAFPSNTNLTLYIPFQSLKSPAEYEANPDFSRFQYVYCSNQAYDYSMIDGGTYCIGWPDSDGASMVRSATLTGFNGDTSYAPTRDRYTVSGFTYRIDTIGENAFAGQSTLKTIDLTKLTNLKYFGSQYEDMGIQNVTRLVLPNSNFNYSSISFLYFNSLAAFELASGSTKFSIYEGSLYNYNKTLLIKVPNAKTGQMAYPNTLTTLWNWCHANCHEITRALLPYGVKTINAGAFANTTNLDYVRIPSSVTNLSNDRVFRGTRHNNYIYCNMDNPPTVNASSYFGSTASMFLYVPYNKEQTYKNAGWTGFAQYNYMGRQAFDYPNVIPASGTYAYSVTSTASATGTDYIVYSGRARLVCHGISSFDDGPSTVEIPASVNISGKNYCVNKIGDRAFNNRTTNFTVTGCVNIDTIGVSAFENQAITSYAFTHNLKSIMAYAFRASSLSGTISLPYGITLIGTKAFGDGKYSRLVVPSSVGTIYGSLCSGTSTLSELVINLKSSNYYNYSGWDLTGVPSSCRILVPTGVVNQYKQNSKLSSRASYISAGAYDFAYYNNYGTTKWYMTILSTTPVTFNNTTYAGKAKYVYHPNIQNATTGGNYGFSISEEDRTVPNDVRNYLITEIGDSLLYGSKFTGGSIPDGVTRIGRSAFRNCEFAAHPLLLPEGLTFIGHYAFYGSKIGGEVIIPSTVTTLENYALCTSTLNSILFPDTQISMGQYLWSKNIKYGVYVPNHLANAYLYWANTWGTEYGDKVAVWIMPSATTEMFSSVVPVDFSGTAVKAYYASAYNKYNTGKEVTMTQVSKIPARTGVLLTNLQANSRQRFDRPTGTVTAPSTNYLVGTPDNHVDITTVDVGYTWFSTPAGPYSRRFVRPTTSTSSTIGHAYLKLSPSEASGKSQVFTNLFPGTSSSIPGDVNGDGHVSSVDVTALYNYLLNNDSSDIVNGDQDGDGHISSVDVTVVYNILLGN